MNTNSTNNSNASNSVSSTRAMIKDKKLISIDVGGTLYGHKSIKTGYGNINSAGDFELGMSGASMRAIIALMERGKHILINSKMEDGAMLQKIVDDINYFYQYQLTGDAEFDNRRLKRQLEHYFYISSFGGNKLSKLVLDGTEFKCHLVNEHTLDTQAVLKAIKETAQLDPTFAVRGVQFKYSNISEQVEGVSQYCGLYKGHYALIELNSGNTADYSRFASALTQKLSGLNAYIEESGKLRLEKACNKATAINDLCSILNISTKEAVHLGDSSTDKLADIDSIIINSRNAVKPNYANSIESQLIL